MTDDANPNPDPEAIIHRILRRHLDPEPLEDRAGWSRCTLVIDDSVGCLALPLRNANFGIVRATETKLRDQQVKGLILWGRILVTRCTADYVADAPAQDLGVIGLDALPNVSDAEAYEDNATAQMVSRAVTEHRLTSARRAWVLMLSPSGQHVFVRLE